MPPFGLEGHDGADTHLSGAHQDCHVHLRYTSESQRLRAHLTRHAVGIPQNIPIECSRYLSTSSSEPRASLCICPPMHAISKRATLRLDGFRWVPDPPVYQNTAGRRVAGKRKGASQSRGWAGFQPHLSEAIPAQTPCRSLRRMEYARPLENRVGTISEEWSGHNF